MLQKDTKFVTFSFRFLVVLQIGIMNITANDEVEQ